MDERELRAERVERAAFTSLYEGCTSALRDALGWRLSEVGGALVSVAEREPSILLNRAFGIGSEEPVTEASLRAVMRCYDQAGVGRYFLHVTETSDDAEALRGALGLVAARPWRKFHRAVAPAPAVKTELGVERVTARHVADFGRIASASFGLTAAAAGLAHGLLSDERWALFMTFAGQEPAGTGAVFLDDGSAWLEWGATDPAFRQRGSQSALMAARIDAALRAGCDYLGTETGEAVAGDPQHSYGNILRSGFEKGALRENWAPA